VDPSHNYIGDQTLVPNPKPKFKPGYLHIGADIKAWDQNTIQCDLANDNWPQPQSPVTTVAALGVILMLTPTLTLTLTLTLDPNPNPRP